MERDGHRLHLGPPAGPLARSAYALLLLAGLGSLAIPWPVWASAKEPAAEAAVDRASGKGPAADAAEAVPLPDLPEAIASFGAAVLEGSSEAEDALYVYGGHIGRTHQHSVQNLSHHFRRLSLADPSAGWQDLGDVQGLQGLAMVPHRGRVCRVGGLDARNSQDAEEEDLHSLATVACFDADTSSWAEMPPLPDPRSSHDAVVVGDSIYVVGGWQLRGAGQEAVWHDYTAVLDLAAEEPAWVNVPQPFRRRALATATAGGLVYAFGGLGEDGTSRDVDIYDPASGVWSKGPEVPAPEGRLKAFGVSAFGVGERIYLSTADGSVHALGAGAEAWNARIGELENPRFFHRLLPHRDRLLFVAGAHREGHLAGLETVQLRALEAAIENPPPAGAAAEARTLPPWPGFRGGGRGLTAPGDLPERWSEEEGVAWRVAVPGYGQSSPVIWGGQVFLTSVEGPKKETLILSSLETGTGEVRWRRLFEASQEIDNTEMMSRGAPTPVVDAERIYAFWESGDVIALDHRGETLWRRSLTREYGDFQGNHGVARSPVLAGGSLMIQVTHEGPSYLLALDPVTGKNRWKADRPPGVAWTTPVVATGPGARGDGGEVLISSAAGRVEALDAATGERLWHLEGIEKNNVPSPTVTPELVLVASSEAGQSLALRRGGRGELSEEQVLWRAEGVSSGFNSPVLAGGCALFLNRSGALTCLDAESGEERWTHRLPETAWATPVVAGERVYVFTQKGKAVVLRPDADGPGIVAENPVPLDGTVYGVAATRGLLVARSGTEAVALVGTPPTGETPTTAVAATSGPSAEPSKADTSD